MRRDLEKRNHTKLIARTIWTFFSNIPNVRGPQIRAMDLNLRFCKTDF